MKWEARRRGAAAEAAVEVAAAAIAAAAEVDAARHAAEAEAEAAVQAAAAAAEAEAEWRRVRMAQKEEEEESRKVKDRERETRRQDGRNAQVARQQNKKKLEKGKKVSAVEGKKLQLSGKSLESSAAAAVQDGAAGNVGEYENEASGTSLSRISRSSHQFDGLPSRAAQEEGAVEGKEAEGGSDAIIGAEERSYRLAQAAKVVMKLHYTDLAYPMARKGLEEAGGIELAVATFKGVSLARNVVAKSALDLAQQQLQLYRIATTQFLDPNWKDGKEAAGKALHFAMTSAISFDAQLADPHLAHTHAVELLGLCDARELAVKVREDAHEALRLAEKEVEGAELERRGVEEQSLLFNCDHFDGAVAASLAVWGRRRDDRAWRGVGGGREGGGHEEEQRRKEERERERGREMQSRPHSLEEALKEGKWALQRCGTHLVYSRLVMKDGVNKMMETQTFTTSKTPSDRRAHANALTQLRHYDADVLHVFRTDMPEEFSADLALVTVSFAINMSSVICRSRMWQMVRDSVASA